MIEETVIDVVPVVSTAGNPKRYIGIGELASRNGVSPYYIGKWADLDLIPCVRVEGCNRLFPEREAMAAVAWILTHYRVKGHIRVPPLTPPPSPPPGMN